MGFLVQSTVEMRTLLVFKVRSMRFGRTWIGRSLAARLWEAIRFSRLTQQSGNKRTGVVLPLMEIQPRFDC